MNGVRFVADTNFLINIHEGNDNVKPFLDGIVYVSIISEIELLGWQNIQPVEIRKLKSLLADCIIIDITPDIKESTILLRQKFKLKTPDAIILATAQYLQLPLVTSDKALRNIPDVDIVLF